MIDFAPADRSRVLYLDHVESDGRLLFEQIVKMDLEGIVC
jgi:ATP-dependent DNA ligase